MDRLAAGQEMKAGSELVSGNGRVCLVMQGDGNLVLYRTDDGRPLWDTGTWGKPVAHAVMQGDGNVVLYDDSGQAHWATNTDGNPGAWLWLQDDGNLVLYGTAGNPLWATNTVQHFGPAAVPGFLPSTRAPRFGNRPWPQGTALQISIHGLPPVSIDVTEMGLCGGMSFLARDIHESGTPQLKGTDSSAIPVPLAQHILTRLVHSFDGPGVVARWLADTQALDHDAIVWGSGLFRRSYNEIPGIIQDIDNGVLSPIGLVLTHSYAPWDVFKNHVVLVWGYERHGDLLTLRTYDCNFPGHDDIVIQMDMSSPTPAKTITTNGTHGPNSGQIRGFFRLPYRHVDPAPAYIDDGSVVTSTPPAATMPAGSRTHVTVRVTNTGSTTWTPDLGYRLGSQSPQDNTTWGLGRVELPVPEVRPGSTATFRFDVTAPGTAGMYDFSWQMLREGVHWFGHAGPPVRIVVGSTGSACEQLHQRHQHLDEQLAQVKAEIAAVDWSDPFIARHEAAGLSRVAQSLRQQISDVEAQQIAQGCAPG
ncbi:NBR1-Ig-like domain-containing protein [Microbispora hainanensis]|uniref:NBR1-Ig-like domain-containing protein n=1 Tax=Microbispora TaxID=2005 RepID=UPI0011CCDE84|nr:MULTISPECIES: NBR1-Ig-like domain-containing protein [Microbispora]